MSKIWISSDWHFGHNKSFLFEPRGCQSIEELNKKIIENHNSIVSPEDDIYVLGDLMLGDNEANIKCISQLKGKIHVIRGNHCTDIRWNEIYPLIPNIVELCGWAHMIKYKKYHFYLSHFPTLCSNLDDDKPLKAKIINLCGHSHTKNRFEHMGESIIYHVEQDAHNNYPVLLDDIIEDIKNYNKN